MPYMWSRLVQIIISFFSRNELTFYLKEVINIYQVIYEMDTSQLTSIEADVSNGSNESPTKPVKPVKPPKPPRAATAKEPENLDVEQMSISEAPPDRPERPLSVFKPSERSHKNIEDILAADANDESLRRYKEALLGEAIHGDKGDQNDPRNLVITEFRVIFAPEHKREDLVFNLDSESGLQKLVKEGITMQEGCKFKFRISFRVQHVILVGIRFVSQLSKLVFSEVDELSLGSYPPSSKIQVFEFPQWDFNEAPSGMLYRGTYRAKNSFIDGDDVTHLKVEYDVHIKKTI